jgi:transposase, IS5 family
MKIHSYAGLFDSANVLEKLTRLGDPLVQIERHIDFEIFRPMLNEYAGRNDEKKAGKGRPSYDVVFMMKVLFVQRLYNLSDDQLEFQINDRLSFRRFLSIPFSDAVPDCKTVWLFREQLNDKDEDRTKKLFEQYLLQLSDNGLIAKEGKMMDATIITVPIQRNNREENKVIKEGNVPENFKENENKLRQKDTDARWTKKHNKSYFGYKNHVKSDAKHKFIADYAITDASVHDSQPACDLLDEKDKGENFYADSAYQTPEIKAKLEGLKMKDEIVEKGYRNKALTDEQKTSNKVKSKTRARVEHIFGFMTNSMNDGTFIRTIGKTRAEVMIGLNNLVYNICRYVQLKKLGIT